MALLRAPPGGWPLADVAAALGVTLPDVAARALGTWLDRMVEWNARIDLTAARSVGELVDLMLADALVLSKHVPEGARVVDVGAGAGAPGLALGILRPDLAVTLVEPLAKRTAFLRTVLAAIDRTDVTVLGQKGEPLAQAGTAFDVAISRATLGPPAWLALGAQLVKPGGDVWVLLAKEPAPAGGAMEQADTHEYTWPGTSANRRAVRYVHAASGS